MRKDQNSLYFVKNAESVDQSKNKVSMIGKSPQFLNTVELALKVANTNSSVFLSGESGVGKELFAIFIHQNSLRRDKPFIIINCPALPESTIESELFGHVRGAFTGAIARRVGKFEAADNGTVFLDEIGDLTLTAQAKLLRVLQNKEIEPLGSNRMIKIDIRVIAATNKNIPKLVKEGKFREDLFYRFNAISINIPPLRERLKDIPEMAKHIISKKSYKKYSLHPKTMMSLKRHKYSGSNIRELEGIIENAIVQAGDNLCIKPEHLKFPDSSVPEDNHIGKTIDNNNLNIAHNLIPILNYLVQKAMDKHREKKSKAAKELGISVFLLRRHLENSNLSSYECLQYIQTDNKENEKSDDAINLPQKKSQGQRILLELDAQSEKIIEIAKKNGRVTNNMVRDQLKMSRASAHRKMFSLVNSGILVQEGKGKRTYYVSL